MTSISAFADCDSIPSYLTEFARLFQPLPFSHSNPDSTIVSLPADGPLIINAQDPDDALVSLSTSAPTHQLPTSITSVRDYCDFLQSIIDNSIQVDPYRLTHLSTQYNIIHILNLLHPDHPSIRQRVVLYDSIESTFAAPHHLFRLPKQPTKDPTLIAPQFVAKLLHNIRLHYGFQSDLFVENSVSTPFLSQQAYPTPTTMSYFFNIIYPNFPDHKALSAQLQSFFTKSFTIEDIFSPFLAASPLPQSTSSLVTHTPIVFKTNELFEAFINDHIIPHFHALIRPTVDTITPTPLHSFLSDPTHGDFFTLLLGTYLLRIQLFKQSSLKETLLYFLTLYYTEFMSPQSLTSLHCQRDSYQSRAKALKHAHGHSRINSQTHTPYIEFGTPEQVPTLAYGSYVNFWYTSEDFRVMMDKPDFTPSSLYPEVYGHPPFHSKLTKLPHYYTPHILLTIDQMISTESFITKLSYSKLFYNFYSNSIVLPDGIKKKNKGDIKPALSNVVLAPNKVCVLRKFVLFLQILSVHIQHAMLRQTYPISAFEGSQITTMQERQDMLIEMKHYYHPFTAQISTGIALCHQIVSKQTISEENAEYFTSLIVSLNNIVQELSDGLMSVVPFGSTASGLAIATSDIDLKLILSPNHFDNSASTLPLYELPETSRGVRLLHKISNEIRHQHGIRLLAQLLHSNMRVKLLQIMVGDVAMDISCSDDQVGTKTQFIRTFIEYHPIVYPLLILVKYWVKARAIHDASIGYLNSFSVSLLVIFFLQIKGILPVIHHNMPPNPHMTPTTASQDLRDELGKKFNQTFNITELLVPRQITHPDPFLTQYHYLPSISDPLQPPPFAEYINLDKFEAYEQQIETKQKKKGKESKSSSPSQSPVVNSFHQHIHPTVSPYIGAGFETTTPVGINSNSVRDQPYDFGPYLSTLFSKSSQIDEFIADNATNNSLYSLDWSWFSHHSELLNQTEFITPAQNTTTTTIPTEPTTTTTLSHPRFVTYVGPSLIDSYTKFSDYNDDSKQLDPRNGITKAKEQSWRYRLRTASELQHTYNVIPASRIDSKNNSQPNKTQSAVPDLFRVPVPYCPLADDLLWKQVFIVLQEFFVFYAFVYNPHHHVISVRTGHLNWLCEYQVLNAKHNFLAINRLGMFIEDPFNPFDNCARALLPPFRDLIMAEFRRSAVLSLSHAPMHVILAPAVSEVIGVHKLFQQSQKLTAFGPFSNVLGEPPLIKSFGGVEHGLGISNPAQWVQKTQFHQQVGQYTLDDAINLASKIDTSSDYFTNNVQNLNNTMLDHFDMLEVDKKDQNRLKFVQELKKLYPIVTTKLPSPAHKHDTFFTNYLHPYAGFIPLVSKLPHLYTLFCHNALNFLHNWQCFVDDFSIPYFDEFGDSKPAKKSSMKKSSATKDAGQAKFVDQVQDVVSRNTIAATPASKSNISVGKTELSTITATTVKSAPEDRKLVPPQPAAKPSAAKSEHIPSTARTKETKLQHTPIKDPEVQQAPNSAAPTHDDLDTTVEIDIPATLHHIAEQASSDQTTTSFPAPNSLIEQGYSPQTVFPQQEQQYMKSLRAIPQQQRSSRQDFLLKYLEQKVHFVQKSFVPAYKSFLQAHPNHTVKSIKELHPELSLPQRKETAVIKPTPNQQQLLSQHIPTTPDTDNKTRSDLSKQPLNLDSLVPDCIKSMSAHQLKAPYTTDCNELINNGITLDNFLSQEEHNYYTQLFPLHDTGSLSPEQELHFEYLSKQMQFKKTVFRSYLRTHLRQQQQLKKQEEEQNAQEERLVVPLSLKKLSVEKLNAPYTRDCKKLLKQGITLEKFPTKKESKYYSKLRLLHQTSSLSPQQALHFRYLSSQLEFKDNVFRPYLHNLQQLKSEPNRAKTLQTKTKTKIPTPPIAANPRVIITTAATRRKLKQQGTGPEETQTTELSQQPPPPTSAKPIFTGPLPVPDTLLQLSSKDLAGYKKPDLNSLSSQGVTLEQFMPDPELAFLQQLVEKKNVNVYLEGLEKQFHSYLTKKRISRSQYAQHLHKQAQSQNRNDL